VAYASNVEGRGGFLGTEVLGDRGGTAAHVVSKGV
jgi:hypothetical protein